MISSDLGSIILSLNKIFSLLSSNKGRSIFLNFHGAASGISLPQFKLIILLSILLSKKFGICFPLLFPTIIELIVRYPSMFGR